MIIKKIIIIKRDNHQNGIKTFKSRHTKRGCLKQTLLTKISQSSKKNFEEREGDGFSIDECQGKDNNARSTEEKSVLVSNMS